ncbi:DeoR/GlpR family DNA-binding transcription regulator [Membranihabitans marinus]|uniref:DeoR/GlpR family DNA-binding transcription regulator n=1 Tax=Membranihabitans marinus TaxID=1227546 RepID=UPI001F45D447|nr:DeoR/GlpR family DNA-binding transcription regulator [Membranihabitans marinus]
MKVSERHRYILDKLNLLGHIYVADLSEELEVSPVTIRKDLTYLEDKSLLYRIHGGASQSDPHIQEKQISEKIHINYAEKLTLAMKAKSYVQPGDSIMLGSGTTMAILAQQLKQINNLTIVTSALQVAMDLGENPSNKIIILGGNMRNTSSSTIGSHAEAMLDHYVCNKLFLSVDGIDIQQGLTTASNFEASLNRKMIQRCAQFIVLADASKLGKISVGKIADLDKVDHLIMNTLDSNSKMEQLLSFGFKTDFV